MNINSKELMLINKNMKFGEVAAPVTNPAAPVAEPTATTPEAGLNALNTQAQNNIAFQGVDLAAVKKAGLKTMLALALFAGASSLQSCEEDSVVYPQQPIEVITNVTVNVDMSAWTTLLQQMLENDKITQEKMDMIIALMQANQENTAAFHKIVVEYIMGDKVMQEMIYNELVEQGQTQEEIATILSSINQLIEDGKYKEALDMIYEILGSIDSTLKNIEATLTGWTTTLQELVNNGKLSTEKQAEISAKLDQLLAELKAGNMTAEEFYKNATNYMIGDSAIQALILSQLQENGKSQEEANAYMQEILNLVNSGKYEEAMNKIYEALANIDASLKTIISQLNNISNDLTRYYKNMMAIEKEQLKYLSGLYKQGKIDQAMLAKLIQLVKDGNMTLDQIKSNTDALLAIASDDTKFNQMIEAIKKNGIDYAKFEEMFKLMNMNIQDVVNMTRAELVAAIEKFKNTYVQTEEQQTNILSDISNKLSILVNFPGIDDGSLQDAIDKLTDAVNNNTDVVSGELNGIQAQLNKIISQLDAMNKKIGTLANDVSTYNKIFASNWQTALAKLDGFNKDMKSLINAQNTSNNYLKALLAKGDAMIEQLNQLIEVGKEGMTIEEYKQFTQERDAANYEKFVKFMIDMGLDELPADVKTIKDLVAALEAKLQNQKDYSAQLDKIISMLDGIDWTNPDYSSKLDTIIKLIQEWKCNCECGNNSGSNEGILGDIEDTLG